MALALCNMGRSLSVVEASDQNSAQHRSTYSMRSRRRSENRIRLTAGPQRFHTPPTGARGIPFFSRKPGYPAADHHVGRQRKYHIRRAELACRTECDPDAPYLAWRNRDRPVPQWLRCKSASRAVAAGNPRQSRGAHVLVHRPDIAQNRRLHSDAGEGCPALVTVERRDGAGLCGFVCAGIDAAAGHFRLAHHRGQQCCFIFSSMARHSDQMAGAYAKSNPRRLAIHRTENF